MTNVHPGFWRVKCGLYLIDRRSIRIIDVFQVHWEARAAALRRSNVLRLFTGVDESAEKEHPFILIRYSNTLVLRSHDQIEVRAHGIFLPAFLQAGVSVPVPGA